MRVCLVGEDEKQMTKNSGGKMDDYVDVYKRELRKRGWQTATA